MAVVHSRSVHRYRINRSNFLCTKEIYCFILHRRSNTRWYSDLQLTKLPRIRLHVCVPFSVCHVTHSSLSTLNSQLTTHKLIAFVHRIRTVITTSSSFLVSWSSFLFTPPLLCFFFDVESLLFLNSIVSLVPIALFIIRFSCSFST